MQLSQSAVRAALLAVVVAAAGLMAAPPSARAQTDFDDFNDGDDAGWTRYQPLVNFGAGAMYNFPNGGYQIVAALSPSPGSLGPSRAGSFRLGQTYTDFSTSVDLVGWDNTHDQAIGLLFRISDAVTDQPGVIDGYAFTYSVGGTEINLTRVTNEVPAGIGATDVTLDPNKDYRLVLTANGSVLTGQVFDLSTPQAPALATVTANDATYAGGVNGVVVFDNTNANTADATFDNYSVPALPIPEPSAAAAGLLSLLAVSAARRRRRRQ